MAGHIEIESNLKQINQSFAKFKDVPKDILDVYFLRLGQLVRGSIVSKVQSRGEGVSGSLGKYSKPYAKKRAKFRRGTNFVDYTVTGQLFQSSTVEKIENGVRIFFRGDHIAATAFYKGASPISNAEIAFHLDNRAEFFGVGNEEEKLVESENQKLLNRINL